ncbi:MAG: TCR/Tet family MFS transporter [bacterium]|nr:TCR/Tet family MFS transporter [bacterium]
MQNKNALIFIFITIMLDAAGVGIIIPTLPELIADVGDLSLDASKNYYLLIGVAYAGMQFLFSPVVGGLSDRFGRRPVLLFSLFGLGLDYLIMFFAPSLIWLVIGRCVSGMFGASYSTAMAYIADISTPEKKTQNFGMVGAAFGVGFIIGPAIGGFLGEVGVRVPFLAAAGVSLINFIYGFFVLKETLPVEKRRPFNLLRSNPIGAIIQLPKYKELGLLFGVIFLYYSAGTAIQFTWVYMTKEKFDWSEGDVGLSLAVVGICVAIVQGALSGFFSRRFGNVRTGYFSMIMFVLSAVGIGMASEGWMLYALMLPYAITGLAGPAIQAIMSNNTKDSEQGELQGTVTSVLSLAEIIGPLIMMPLYALTTVGMPDDERIFGTPYYAAAVLVAIAALLFYWATKRFRTEELKENSNVLDAPIAASKQS